MSFRHQNFPVYQDAIRLHHDIVVVTGTFPWEFEYLRTQLRRAALSIILNIAEGAAKKSDRDFNRYLKNSLGSAGEVVGGLDAALMEKLITDDEHRALGDQCQDISNQLGGFSKALASAASSKSRSKF